VDEDRCWQAVEAADARFDGWIFCGVTSTGIYCRPSCPARTPRRENVRFYPTAAAAQAAGFRACKRCRPDATPGSPDWDRRGDLVGRAMRLIADGVVDREGVGGLVRRLGYTPRHVHRELVAVAGAGPQALARAQRAQAARLMIETTDLPVTTVAFAAGFGSVRQFNDTVRQVFALSPTALRARAHRRTSTVGQAGSGVVLRLPVRTPFDGAGVVAFLARRAVAGVEEVVDGTYRRSLDLPYGAAVVELTPHADHLLARLHLDDLRDLAVAVSRSRALFDLDSDPTTVVDALGSDARMGALVRARPGRRVPGHVGADEIAVRAVLGQQVSLASAAALAARLVAAHGEALAVPLGGVTHRFPTAAALAAADPATLAMPRARATALHGLATALAGGTVRIDEGADRETAGRGLAALTGIGPWTVGYVALRALRDPDAFLPTDLGVRKAIARLGGDDRAVTASAWSQAWRPYRAYAMVHLWASLVPALPAAA
jgi:AraC family transcriptional regulator of adaptative response / DNA-3-methyladenine glycosylase II